MNLTDLYFSTALFYLNLSKNDSQAPPYTNLTPVIFAISEFSDLKFSLERL